MKESEISQSDESHFSVDYRRQQSAEKSENLNLIIAFYAMMKITSRLNGFKTHNEIFYDSENCIKIFAKVLQTFQESFKLVRAGKFWESCSA